LLLAPFIPIPNVTTSARNVTTFCYDLDLKNHSVLQVLLRRYDLLGGDPLNPVGTRSTASQMSCSISPAFRHSDSECCAFRRKCCDFCCNFDLTNHSALPTLLRCCDFQGDHPPLTFLVLVLVLGLSRIEFASCFNGSTIQRFNAPKASAAIRGYLRLSAPIRGLISWSPSLPLVQGRARCPHRAAAPTG